MSGDISIPLPSNPVSKFRPSEVVCAPGEPVEDTSFNFDGYPVCSSCRGRMKVSIDFIWVHK